MKQHFKENRTRERLLFGIVSAIFAVPLMAKTVTVAEGLNVKVDESVKGEYHFAHGFGLLYGAMPVTRSLGILERMYPNATFTWRTVQNTSEQRDAMLANRLDFGSCSAGPFLQGWDKGVGWVWLQTTSGFDAYLMVQPDGPDSIAEFIGTNKKLSPGPNTAQYFTSQELLREAGQDIHALDKNWVSLPHPDAAQALIAGQLDAHFATTNFALSLEKQGAKKIGSFKSVYGSLYPIGACTMKETVERLPKMSKGYAEVLSMVAQWMKTHPELAAQELSKSTNGKESAENFLAYMQTPIFDSYSKDANLKKFAESMKGLGAISKVPGGPEEIYAFPEQAGSKW